MIFMRRFMLIGIAMLLLALLATVFVWYLLQGTIPLEVEEIVPEERAQPSVPDRTGSFESDAQRSAEN